MRTEPRTLEAMARRATSWEIIARDAQGQEIRLGFSERKTKGALLKAAQAQSETVLALLGDWDGEATYSASTGWVFGPVAVHFSGRTERDLASLEG